MEDARLDQFRKMAEADPENELGHLSLGKAYLDAGRPAEAVPCLQRAIELNGQNSKAYHLLAMAQKASGQQSEALATLRLGIDVADARGDRMPRSAMAKLMTELGETPPAPPAATAAPAVEAGSGQIVCRRCGQTRPPLPDRPFKGPLGEQVLASVCPECWRGWIGMGTKVINELRLDLSNPQHAATYDQHMKEFLNLA